MSDYPLMDEARAEMRNEAIARKISKDDLKDLILSRLNVTRFKLGQGSYGTVYKAEYNGTTCAAKQADSEPKRVEQTFLLECLQHSRLNHPNIVKMLGVFYTKTAVLPFMVMELMECNLTQLLEKHQNISMYVKLSILQDVSRGLGYLHAQNPPIVHQALYSDNILFTKGLIAKIADFKTGAETVSDQVLLSVRQNRDSRGFLPDYAHILKYDMSLNVFSFGCVVCHVITQRWPGMHKYMIGCSWIPPRTKTAPEDATINQEMINPLKIWKKLSYTVDDWCVEKHQDYIDMINNNSLKQLTEACLQKNSKNRPPMSLIYERITSIMKGMVECLYILRVSPNNFHVNVGYMPML